jgi:hypothetical protein
MKRIFYSFILLAASVSANAQAVPDSINIDSLRVRTSFLASNEMKGRGNYSKNLFDAASYISGRFEAAGLKYFPGFDSYLQPFGIKNDALPVKDSSGYNYNNCLVNVIGVLEGKTRPGEAIIISAHFDHMGAPMQIYNGANDNASGVAGLLALVDFYSKEANNARTIIFCAFSGEELGLLGSAAFAGSVEPRSIVAGINFDMIGVPLFGKKKFMLTGDDYSDMYKIFRENSLNEPVKPRKEQDAKKQLFFRSDNFPFVQLGIPAHTIMAADDTEGCYHDPCDDVKNIDFKYMQALLRSVIICASTIVNGKDTPKRITAKF